MDVPELLAPAGGMRALMAALAAGADAVYVGMGAYSARAASGGLSPAELARACALAHERGSRVYVALNALVHDTELAEAVELAVRAQAAGADAFIVADVGLAQALARALPEVELHLSTQAGAESAGAALLAARELGVARVTCARELSVAELAALCGTGVPIEAFCHGAICVCYSGACAFSALRRGRSANRGDCTQPCRMGYTLEDGSGRPLAGGPQGRGCGGDRLLCPRDVLGIRHVGALARAGVAALKIEGRMKNPDYVFNTVRCYRTALDAVAAGRPVDADALERQLAHSFNRGFTDAYLRGARGAALGAGFMSFERSCNQGAPVGELREQRRDEAVVALTAAVHAGDTLEIRSTPGAHTFPGVPKRWPMVPVPADTAAGGLLHVHCKRRVEPGSAVHVVRDARLFAETETAVRRLEGVLLAEGPGGGAAAGDGTAGAGAARGTASARRRLGAAGAEAHAAGAQGAGASVGAAVDGAAHPVGRPPVRHAGATDRPGLVIAVRSPEQAREALSRGDVEVAVPAWRLRAADGAMGAACDGRGSRADVGGGGASGGIDSGWTALLPALTVVLDEVERRADEAFSRLVCARARAVVCRNLGQIDLAREAGALWDAAAPLSTWNARTVFWLAGLGARCVWLPDELSVDELCAIGRAVDAAVPMGALAVGRPQLMVTEHCLLTAEGPCDGRCGACVRRAPGRFLVEEGGARLPVEVDARGRTRVFDETLLDRRGACARLRAAGIGRLLVDIQLGGELPAGAILPAWGAPSA